MGYIILGLSSYNAYSSLGSSEGLEVGTAHFNYLHGTITGCILFSWVNLRENSPKGYIPHLGGLAVKMPLITTFLFWLDLQV